jgi:hypothetical protein
MNAELKIIFTDKIVRLSGGISLFLLLVVTMLIALFYRHFPPLIPLLNSLPWGTDRLFSSVAIVFIPLILLSVIILNTLFAARMYVKHTLLARILSFNALLFVILGFLAYLQILLLIF